MKKILICLLVVFMCGVLAFTIPKSASASSLIDTENLEPSRENNLVGDYEYYLSCGSTIYNYMNIIEIYLQGIIIDYSVSLVREHTNQDEYLITINNIYIEIIDDKTVNRTIELSLNGLQLHYYTFISPGMLNNETSPFEEPISQFDIEVHSIASSSYDELELDITLYLYNNLFEYDSGNSYTTYLYIDLLSYDIMGNSGMDLYYLSHYSNVIFKPYELYLFRLYAYDYYELMGTPIIPVTPHFTDWIGTAVGGFLDLELVPGFSIGLMFWLILALGVLMIILKMFAGG